MSKNNIQKYLFRLVISLSIMIGCSFFFLNNITQAKDFQEKEEKKWTDDEIIELGYIPNEVLIKYKDNKIKLNTESGEEKAKSFIKNKSKEISPKIIKNLSKNQKKAEQLNSLTSEKIDKLSEEFFYEKETLPFVNTSVLKLNLNDSVMETIEQLKNDPNVEYAIPNYVFEFETINDWEYTEGNQWGAEKIRLEDAMDEMTGTIGDVVVAVLDTGLSFTHSDFGSTNLWDGSGTNGCKDENGTVREEGCPNHGWDFVHNDDNPTDDYTHGTYVAGVLGAIKNTTGIAGTSSNVKMMIIKVGNSYAKFTDIEKGVNFAKENNAKIINASFGSFTPDGSITSALNDFLDSSILTN